jgi:regulator of cell morphogenesis and NO signaling
MNTMSLIKPGNVFDNEMYLATSALSKSGIDGHDVKNTFGEKDSMMSFDKYPADFLIDYIIKTHHAFARKNTAIIYNLLQKIAYRHSDQHSELKKFSEVAFFFFQDLLNQMLKEEQDLFPYIRQEVKHLEHGEKPNRNTSNYFEERIKLQEVEHAKSFNYLRLFREITNDYKIPPGACWYYMSLFEKMQQLEQDLKVHFHLEGDILFHKAIAADNESRRQSEPQAGIDALKVSP